MIKVEVRKASLLDGYWFREEEKIDDLPELLRPLEWKNSGPFSAFGLIVWWHTSPQISNKCTTVTAGKARTEKLSSPLYDLRTRGVPSYSLDLKTSHFIYVREDRRVNDSLSRCCPEWRRRAQRTSKGGRDHEMETTDAYRRGSNAAVASHAHYVDPRDE